MSELVCHCPAEPLSYAAAYALQMRCHTELVAPGARVAHLFLLQHTPVYTLGRATRAEHLLVPRDELARRTGAEVVEADRGGSVTYHGPGQLVAYLLLNLKTCDMTIHQHLWNLEEAAIQTLAAFGLRGQRAPAMTGVWVDVGSAAPQRGVQHPAEQLAKICAIGVGCRRWVTYHGLALNVDMDLAPFSHIDPCGLGRRPVTSLARQLGRSLTISETAAHLAAALAQVLHAELAPGSP